MTNKDLLKLLETYVKDYPYKRTKKILIDDSNPLIYKMIEPKKYRGKVDGEEVFKIHIGIFIPQVYQMIFEQTNDIITADCIIGFQVDELMSIKLGKQKGKIWIYQNIDDLKIELYQTFKEFIIPFFDTIKELSDVDDFIEANNLLNKNIGIIPLQRAILKFFLYKNEEGKRMLSEIINKHNENTEYCQKVILIGEKLANEKLI